MIYYIIQKDGHRYDFNKIREIRIERYGQSDVSIIVISGQFKERQRYKDVRILPETIKESNIPDIKHIMLNWVS